MYQKWVAPTPLRARGTDDCFREFSKSWDQSRILKRCQDNDDSQLSEVNEVISLKLFRGHRM